MGGGVKASRFHATPPPPLRGSSMAGRKSVSVVWEAPAGGAAGKVLSGRDKCECDAGLHGVYHSLSRIYLLLVFLLVGCFEFLRNCGIGNLFGDALHDDSFVSSVCADHASWIRLQVTRLLRTREGAEIEFLEEKYSKNLQGKAMKRCAKSNRP